MKQEGQFILSSNQRDFKNYRWLVLLFLIIWGAALILFLFRLKWLLIIAFVALYFSFKKAFQLEICLFDHKILIKKKFFGIPYRIIKQSFSRVLFFSKPEGIKFQGLNDALFIQLETDSISLSKAKFTELICNKKEADKVFEKLRSALKSSKLNSDMSIIKL